MVYGELELLIRHDMQINGFNPDDKYDIEAYWNERLS